MRCWSRALGVFDVGAQAVFKGDVVSVSAMVGS
jgi:hypothetical protein